MNIAEIKDKIFKSKTARYIFLAVLVVAAIAIFFSTFTNKKNSVSSSTSLQKEETSSSLVLDYSNKVAVQIEELLGHVNGLSNVKVVVVVSQSPETKYLYAEGSTSSSLVLEKQSSISKPVVVTEIAPKINGILIVAKGANNVLLKNKLTNALSAIYSVDISKIDILEGK